MSVAGPSNENLSLEQEKFLQRLITFIREKKLFESGDRVLLACSGGLDSSVLAHSVVRVSKLLGVELSLVHVDHSTRGEMSAQEGRWVGVLAQRLNIPCYSLTLARMEKSSQATLRDGRRQLLSDLAHELGASVIATAHHGDDNAETFIMRAMAGTGLKGLAAIAPKEGRWVRPLLWATRSEIEDYARKHQIGWVEDPTNLRGIYLRNRVRLELLPLMEELRPASLRNLNRLAERIEVEESEWESWITAQLEGPRDSLSLAWLEKWPQVLQRRILRVWLSRLSIEAQPQLLEALLRGEDIVHTQGTFLRRADQLLFHAGEDFAEPWSVGLPISLGKRQPLGSSLAWSFLPGAKTQSQSLKLTLNWVFRDPSRENSGRQQFAWNRIPKQLEVRARDKNDPKEFDSILGKAGIPKPYWKAWPVLSSVDERKVLALVGVHVVPEYALKDLERCVCLEAFFEDSLSPIT